MKPTRLLVVLGCYTLSGLGLAYSSFLLGFHWLVACLVVYAWVAHLALCVIWVWQKPMNWLLAKTGTVCGLVCLVIAPVGFLFVFPCVLPAVHIIRYYVRNTPAVHWFQNR
jgi:hypothetical protein